MQDNRTDREHPLRSRVPAEYQNIEMLPPSKISLFVRRCFPFAAIAGFIRRYFLRLVAAVAIVACFSLVIRVYMYLRPVYHESFYLVISAVDGWATVRTNTGALKIVNVETGREVRLRFSQTRHAHRMTLMPGGMVVITRHGEHGSALICIETRNEIIPFGRYSHIIDLFDGVAIVAKRDEQQPRWQWLQWLGVIDMETGEEIMPFLHQDIRRISDTLVLARIPYQHRSAYGVVNIITGEAVIPFHQYDFITLLSSGLLQISLDGQMALMDMQSSEISSEIITPFSTDHWFNDAAHGMAVTRQRIRSTSYYRLMDIATGWSLVSLGVYDRFEIVSENAVVVRRAEEWGIFDPATRTESVPLGRYRFGNTRQMVLFSFHVQYIIDGMMVIGRDNEYALVYVPTWEIVIPFGKYEGINLLTGELIAVLNEGSWRFESILRTE